MVALDSRLRCREDDVVAKIMDGEAIIINLANGVYYSLDQVGATMWELIEQGHRLNDVVAAIVAEYDVQPAAAQTDALRLAEELLQEKLVVESAEPAAAQPPCVKALAIKQPYSAPRLNAYTDMEDLLAFDPPTPGFSDIPWKE